jgi:hypothetical protein
VGSLAVCRGWVSRCSSDDANPLPSQSGRVDMKPIAIAVLENACSYTASGDTHSSNAVQHLPSVAFSSTACWRVGLEAVRWLSSAHIRTFK